MNEPYTYRDFAAQAAYAGVSIAALCRIAKVPESTFHRWKSGAGEPGLAAYRKLVKATNSLDVPDARPLCDYPRCGPGHPLACKCRSGNEPAK